MRKALLLPALFLIPVAPIALWMVSGNGTHMTPLLLYPFATPWWLFFPDGSIATPENAAPREQVALLAGCAINAVILGGIGWLIDTWARAASGR